MSHLMKITDAAGQMLVRGASRIDGRLGWIEIIAVNWVHTGNSTNLKHINAVRITKARDNASIWLARKTFGDSNLDPVKITIEMYLGNGVTQTFVLIDALFDRMSAADSSSGPVEEYEVSFKRMSTGYASVTSA